MVITAAVRVHELVCLRAPGTCVCARARASAQACAACMCSLPVHAQDCVQTSTLDRGKHKYDSSLHVAISVVEVLITNLTMSTPLFPNSFLFGSLVFLQ